MSLQNRNNLYAQDSNYQTMASKPIILAKLNILLGERQTLIGEECGGE